METTGGIAATTGAIGTDEVIFPLLVGINMGACCSCTFTKLFLLLSLALHM